MYHTILVPLDGSKRAETILPHVENLAINYDARVIFLLVLETSIPVMTRGVQDMQLLHQELEQAEEQADSYLSALEGEFRNKGIEAQTNILSGPVVEGIITTAEQVDADLIAIASHGRTGLAQVFYGSVAAGVLQRIDRPLLLIRTPDAG
jgi:nucleotide-binding universal stress UspA family protein